MTPAPGQRSHILFAILAFAAGLAAQLPAVTDRLLWDDAQFVASNPFVSDCGNLARALDPVYLFKVLPVRMSARPVVNVSLLADACSGAGPRGMRVTNALLHACGAAMLFALLLVLCGSPPAALFGALVFALHPAVSEAVQIVAFRSHLLGFFFFSGALALAVLAGRGAGLSVSLAGAACYFLAVLSVETAAVLPLSAALAVWFDSGKAGLRRAVPLFTALALLGAFYLWFRVPRSGYELPGSRPGVSAPSALYPAALLPPPSSPPAAGRGWSELPPWRAVYASGSANLYTMSAVMLGYLRELVLPLGLKADYAPKVITDWRRGLPALAVCLAVLAAGLVLFFRRRLSGLGLMLTLTALLPALDLVHIYNLRADRYLYLPLAGFALLAAAAFRRAESLTGPRRTAVLAAGAVWLAGLGALTVSRWPQFADDRALFSEAAAGGSPRAHANLAGTLLRGGDCDGAVKESAEAARLDPGDPFLRLRLAYALAWCGRGREALAAIASAPETPDTVFLRGLACMESDPERAVGLISAALEKEPGRADMRLALGLALGRAPAGLDPASAAGFAAELDAFKKGGLRGATVSASGRSW